MQILAPLRNAGGGIRTFYSKEYLFDSKPNKKKGEIENDDPTKDV
jgi:hypothetical protein